MLMLWKTSMFAAVVGAAALSSSAPASATDKCDIATLVAMAKYGEMRLEITQTADTKATLGPAADAMRLVELLGCDMERTRAGIDCVGDPFPSFDEKKLTAYVLDCGSQVGLRTQAE